MKGPTTMKKMKYDAILPEIMTQIKTGAFLSVKADEDLNVMTIGWASFGFIWGKPIMTVAVRPTRFTFGIIERAKDFCVSVPAEGMLKEIEYCGSHSGRDGDKLKMCNLATFPAIKAHSPILAIDGIHIECKIVCKAPVDPKMLVEEYDKIYPKKDYHTLYFGEIIECYSTDGE
jgi:flavin reductase (DIM6/NTAB) family NADH-FMN oxidoreductase RutF